MEAISSGASVGGVTSSLRSSPVLPIEKMDGGAFDLLRRLMVS